MTSSIDPKPLTIIDRLEQRTTFLDTKEIMEIINEDRNTVCRWVRIGYLPASRVGNKNKYDPVQLAAWLRTRQIT